MKKKKQHTILKGEGANQHTLYGEFAIDENAEMPQLQVSGRTILKHEQPNGEFGEHKGLVVENGTWSVGKQVEYNPFNQKIERVWD